VTGVAKSVYQSRSLRERGAALPGAVSNFPLLMLLELLLSDAATDVKVVTRELGLRNEMLERLRRALDRIECAQGVLDALESRMRTGTVSAQDGLRVKAAMDLLASRWPQAHPVGAVEWEILGRYQRPPCAPPAPPCPPCHPPCHPSRQPYPYQ